MESREFNYIVNCPACEKEINFHIVKIATQSVKKRMTCPSCRHIFLLEINPVPIKLKK